MNRRLKPLPEQTRRCNNTTGHRYVSWKHEGLARVSFKIRGYPRYTRCFGGPDALEDAVRWRDLRLRMMGFLPPSDED